MLEFVVIYSGLKMTQHSSMEITKGSYLRSRLKGFAGGPCPGMKLDVSCVWGYNVFRKQGLKNAANFCRVSTLNCVGFGGVAGRHFSQTHGTRSSRLHAYIALAGFSVFNWPCLKLCKEFLLLLRLVGSTVFPHGLCGPLYKHSVVLLVRFSSHLFVHH